MYLIADGIGVISGGRYKKIQWLHSCITAAFQHDIIQFSIGLGVQLIKNDPVGIKAVLVRYIGRQSFVLASGGDVLHFLLGCLYIHFACQHRTSFYHCEGNVKYDLCLVSVCGTAVHFRSRLKVRTEKVQCNSGSKLRLALLLGNFDISGIELPIAVRLQDTEDIPDDLLLPVNQLKGLTIPGAFGMTAELFDKANRMIGGILIVVAILRHEAGRLIMF